MNPYDQAHELARTLKETDEYREMERLRDSVMADETNRALLTEYKRLQFQLQAKAAGGETLPQEDMSRLQQIGTLLQFNPEVSAYMMAEFRFQRMLSDIFKILGEAAGIDLDALQQS